MNDLSILINVQKIDFGIIVAKILKFFSKNISHFACSMDACHKNVELLFIKRNSFNTEESFLLIDLNIN